MSQEPAAVLLLLFWLVAGLFLFGIAASIGIPWVGRITGRESGRLRTVAMQAGQGFAFSAGALVTGAAAAYLESCDPGRAAHCAVGVMVWQVPPPVENLPQFNLALYVDPLAALFIALAGFFTACGALYSTGWLRGDDQRHTVAAGFNLFALATLFTLVVGNGFWLLLALELNSLAFGYLVLYRWQSGRPASDGRRAIQTYLIVSHLSTMLLAVAILILGVEHRSLDFEAFRSGAGIGTLTGSLVFVLALLGLGVRAGMVPFHFWVPIVHPQSPTTTHAFSLGVSIKVALYLMIRFFFEFLGPIIWWWGSAVLLLAGLTALVNVFYALLSKDLKTALAFHSVENVGIILAGIGLALLFAANIADGSLRSVAGLALVAGLFHTVNHALFKGLLYLATGSIEKKTGTVEMEALGGVLGQLPWTGLTFLAGAVAIAGFPPFNGFISEWLTLQALFTGQAVYRVELPASIVILPVLLGTLIMLAVSFAMTALAFVKIAGETILGSPRRGAYPAGPTPRPMRAVLLLLAVLCLALGVMPWLLIPWLTSATAGLEYSPSIAADSWARLTVGGETSYRATLPTIPLLALAIVPPLLVAIAALLRRAGRPREYGPVWTGGEAFDPATRQYTGTALSALLWEPLSSRSPRLDAGAALPTTIHLSGRHYVVRYFSTLYDGLMRALIAFSTRFGDRFQNGDIRSYLLYIIAAFMIALTSLVIFR